MSITMAKKQTPKEQPKAKVVVEEETSSSESEVESLVSEEELEDDLDVADVSSDEVSSEEGSEDNSDDDSFPLRKKKKTTDDGSESFATAFNAIIGSKLKAYDRKDPILARNKRQLKKLESDKLEAKAKRALLAEKKQLQDKHRIKVLLPSAEQSDSVREILEREKQMKKIAQRGVVRLFNAVLATQVKTQQEATGVKAGVVKKEELMTEISKEKFLDLVQAAGQQ